MFVIHVVLYVIVVLTFLLVDDILRLQRRLIPYIHHDHLHCRSQLLKNCLNLLHLHLQPFLLRETPPHPAQSPSIQVSTPTTLFPPSSSPVPTALYSEGKSPSNSPHRPQSPPIPVSTPETSLPPSSPVSTALHSEGKSPSNSPHRPQSPPIPVSTPETPLPPSSPVATALYSRRSSPGKQVPFLWKEPLHAWKQHRCMVSHTLFHVGELLDPGELAATILLSLVLFVNWDRWN